MLRFDEKFDSMEHYLWNAYAEYTRRFFNLCKENKEVEGHTMEEIKEICPKIYEAFQDTNDFLDYTEKFLGYKYDHNQHCFNYIGPVTKQGNKEIVVDTSLREEFVSIYDENDQLIVRSCNPLVIESVRLQILEKELNGYYAIGEDGTKCDIILKGTYFPFQDKLPRISARILQKQIEYNNL